MKSISPRFCLFISLCIVIAFVAQPLLPALAQIPLRPPRWLEDLKSNQLISLRHGPASLAPLPAWIEASRLETPLTAGADFAVANVAPQTVSERQRVLVQLAEPSLADLASVQAGRERQMAQASLIEDAQDRFIETLSAAHPTSRVLARLSRSLNAIVLETDAAGHAWLARQPGVLNIFPIADYRLENSQVLSTADLVNLINATTSDAGNSAGPEGSVILGQAQPDSTTSDAGSGIRIAILDSGIDFTHAKLGGPGTPTAYAAAYCGRPDARPDPTDPTCNAHTQAPQFNAKVVGGYDFVGESWPRGPLAPDPNPIDFFGHGTQMADIAAGLPLRRNDRARLRLAHFAAGATNVNVFLNGEPVLVNVAFRTITDYAVLQPGAYRLQITPAGQTQPALAETTLTLEPGQDYTVASLEAAGAPFLLTLADNLSAPAAEYVHVRFINTASEGRAIDIALANGGPVLVSNLAFAQASDYVTLPASRHAFEVLDTETSARLTTSTALTFNGGRTYTGYLAGIPSGTGSRTFVLEWSMDDSGTTTGVAPGAVLYAVKVCSAVADACSGVALLQGLEFALDPNGDGDLSDRVDIVNLSLSKPYGLAYDEALSMAILSAGSAGVLTVGVAGDNGNKPYTVSTPGASYGALSVAATSHTGTVLSNSSRGPNGGQMFYNNDIMYAQLIKPEIAAPGSAEAARAGSGSGTRALSGTDVAAARVSGAAAVLIHATERRLWQTEIKSRLMNTAESRVLAEDGRPAPVTRIGSGELRLERALNAQAVAWEEHNRGGALAFGFVDVATHHVTLTRRIFIRNLSHHPIHYRIVPSFRDEADALSGAVSMEVQEGLEVPPGETCPLEIRLHIDGSRLSGWWLNSGANGDNGQALTALEFDGYLNLIDEADPRNNLSLPWHVLPRRAGDTEPATTTLYLENRSGQLELFNHGIGPAYVDGYSLVAVSENQAASFAGLDRTVIDLKAVGVRTFPVPAGFCSPAPSFLLAFAISTHYRQSHANAPGRLEINLDLNRDGVADYQMFNADMNQPNVSAGRNVVWVRNLMTGVATARFYVGHALESGNFTLVACAEQLGLTLADYGRAIGVRVDARDWANSGQITDTADGIAIVVGGDRFLSGGGDIAPNSSVRWIITDRGAAGTSPSEFGLLLLTDAPRLENGRPTRSGAADPAREAWVIHIVP
ncbi:MAG: S8 family serine peptidase [Anaerolineales bacterium]|nr:S8 family serine peptidase [Anaerolineales bacterium]